MCNAKNDQNEIHTESKVSGWGTTTEKSPTKNAQPKAQAGFNSNGKGSN
jgi:hypothetical protein